jgi:SSS family transporter
LPHGLGRIRALVAQANGERECLYLATDNGSAGNGRLHEFDPVKGLWRERSPMPGPIMVEQVTPMGAHHILIAGTLDGTRVSYIYHTIIDSWAPINSAQLLTTLRVVRPSREPLLLCDDGAGGSGLYRIEGAQPQPRFYWLDYTALGAYLLLLVAVGMYFTMGERTTDDFFLAGRRIPWWAAALSLMATQVSSIGFIAVPAKTFATDWVYFIGVLSWFVIVPIVTRVYIPFFRRLNVTSAYEYLEVRFNVSVRLFAAVVFSLLQIGRMAVVLYLPALVLSVVTGIPIYGCVLIMGVLATAYTTAGGMEAVIWTDVLQALLLLGGALLCVVVAVAKTEGGIGEVVATAFSDDKLRLVGTGWDITSGAVWVILLGSVFSRFSSVSADQSVIQRYLTTTDEKQAARALWGDVAVSIPWAFIVFMMGTALYVFYKAHPGQVTPGLGADAMVPMFVSQELPMGVSGLIIAAIFAAAMSSLDSSIHSVATVVVTEMFQRFRPSSSERVRLNLARVLTVLLGVFGTGMALFMASTFVVSVWDVFLEIMGLLAGVLAGLFLLGLFTLRANSAGAMVGALLGALTLYWVKQHTDIHFFLYSVIGIGVCFIGGYALSILLPGVPKVRSLTVFTQHQQEAPAGGTEQIVSVTGGPGEGENP